MRADGPDLRVTITIASPFPIDAAFACGRGELMALVGPSGSGKSTLLRAIAGLVRPTRGRIACGDTCWFDPDHGIDLPTLRRRVGFVPQHYGLFPHMTALDNVMAGLAHLDPTARIERARLWLAKVNMSGHAAYRPAELSGGQQQRVALARALAREPAALLLDEPFSAVDGATREALYPELALIKRDLAIPVVMVTHDLREAMLLADRLALLFEGRTLQEGLPSEVLAKPVDETAARLVGVRNCFDGTILRHDANAHLTWFRAGGCVLACTLDASRPEGSAVRWMLPGTGVRLRSLSQGRLPDGLNRVPIEIRSTLTLGNDVRILATMPGIEEPLIFDVSRRLVDGLALGPGARTDALLRESQIHIFGGPVFGQPSATISASATSAQDGSPA